MNDEIQYRRLRPSEATNIVKNIKNIYFDSGNINDFWSEVEIESWLSNGNDFCIGAFLNEVIVGFCLTHYHHEANKVNLENIFVIEDLRRKGIARIMVDEVILHYNKQGKKIRYVGLVSINNINTISFLKNMDFNVGDKMFWIQKNYEGIMDK